MQWHDNAISFCKYYAAREPLNLIAFKMEHLGFTFFSIDCNDTNREKLRQGYERIESHLLKSKEFCNSSTFPGWGFRRIPLDMQLLRVTFSVLPPDVLQFFKKSRHTYKVYHISEVKALDTATKEEKIMKLHVDFQDQFLRGREQITLAVSFSFGQLRTEIMCDLNSKFVPASGPYTLYSCTTNAAMFDGRNFHRGIGGESRRIFISLIDDSLHDLKKERITAANGRVYLGVYKATAISIIDIVQGINDDH